MLDCCTLGRWFYPIGATVRARNSKGQFRSIQSQSDRFWSKVDKSGECWLFQGTTARGGYGTVWFYGKHRLAHAVSYELEIGPIPEGLVIDHLCRNHACVRPSHLEAVTDKVNILRGISPTATNKRKTHCKRGHELAGEQLRIRADGSRVCLICKAQQRRESYALTGQ